MSTKTQYGWSLTGQYAHAQSLFYWVEDFSDESVEYTVELLGDSNGIEISHTVRVAEDLIVVFGREEENALLTPYVITMVLEEK